MKTKFWNSIDGNIVIIHSKLIDFLNESGFAKAEISEMGYVLVLEKDNMVSEIGDHKIVEFVQAFLKKEKETDVLEAFTKGLSSYVSNSKLRLLKSVDLLDDKDGPDHSWFHFRNVCCKVESDRITILLYENIEKKIWASRILNQDCYLLSIEGNSQFRKFCWNISGKDQYRFDALRSIIGYLLHRYQDPGNARAIILTDENISHDGTANGGTGKSLLVSAIGKCREVVVMDGKHDKEKSWFKNQRINRTTDVIFYDDVRRDFSLETLYSMITTGISVEKKYKAEEYIPPDKSPKICVSSNFVVRGTGGSTDIRRRCDFELAPHYDEISKPEDEFGNLFFKEWDDEEWSEFYHFMMGCVQFYFKNGLIIPKPINLERNKLINETSTEFVGFLEDSKFKTCEWYGKKEEYDNFLIKNPQLRSLSMHQMTKWFKVYCKQNRYRYVDRKSGDKYQFRMDPINNQGKEGSDGSKK